MQEQLKALGARIWQHQDASALDMLEPLVLANPNLVGGHRLLVNGSLKFGDPDRAARALDRFAQHHPDHPDLPPLRGHVARLTAPVSAASAAPVSPANTPRPAVQPDPEPPLPSARVLFDLGLAALDRGHPHDALNFFGFGDIPTSPDPARLNPYALALKSIGDTAGLARLLAHIDTLPETAATHMAAGNVASHLGDRPLAGARYHRARDLAPDLPQAWQRQADIALQDGQPAQAAALLADLPGSLRDHPGLTLTRARALLAAGQSQSARALLDAMADADRSPDWQLMQARLAQAALDPAAVIATCDPLLEQGDLTPALRAEALEMRALARVLRFAPQAAWEDALAANALRQRQGALRLRARQGIVGGLVNEMRLDPDATARLAAAQTGPDPLRALANELTSELAPDSAQIAASQTAAALALLLALPRTDTPEITPEIAPEIIPDSPVSEPIPAKIYHYWEQGSPPDSLTTAIADLKTTNPWADHVLLDPRSALGWLRAHAPAPVLRAWRICRQTEERADLLRLAVMGITGGIWLGNDTRVQGNLRPLLAPRSDRGIDLLLCQDPTGAPVSGFMAAAPDQPILRQALNDITEAQLAGASEFIWLRTGPGALARTLADTLAQSIAKGAPLPPGLRLLRPDDLARVVSL